MAYREFIDRDLQLWGTWTQVTCHLAKIEILLVYRNFTIVIGFCLQLRAKNSLIPGFPE